MYRIVTGMGDFRRRRAVDISSFLVCVFYIYIVIFRYRYLLGEFRLFLRARWKIRERQWSTEGCKVTHRKWNSYRKNRGKRISRHGEQQNIFYRRKLWGITGYISSGIDKLLTCKLHLLRCLCYFDRFHNNLTLSCIIFQWYSSILNRVNHSVYVHSCI